MDRTNVLRKSYPARQQMTVYAIAVFAVCELYSIPSIKSALTFTVYLLEVRSYNLMAFQHI